MTLEEKTIIETIIGGAAWVKARSKFLELAERLKNADKDSERLMLADIAPAEILRAAIRENPQAILSLLQQGEPEGWPNRDLLRPFAARAASHFIDLSGDCPAETIIEGVIDTMLSAAPLPATGAETGPFTFLSGQQYMRDKVVAWHLQEAVANEKIAEENSGNDVGVQCHLVAADHRVNAHEISAFPLLDQGHPDIYSSSRQAALEELTIAAERAFEEFRKSFPRSTELGLYNYLRSAAESGRRALAAPPAGETE